MIFIIHNSNNSKNQMGDYLMNALHLFVFYVGLIILYHATTRIK